MKLIALTVGPYKIETPGQITNIDSLSLQQLVSFALSFLLTAAVLLAFIFFLIGGLKWMLSQGDKKQVEEAQKTLTYAIVGLVITLLSFFIINLVGFAFQVPLMGK
ncbi:MAG TPA: hypothetical protein VLB73_04490 [Patescibacteria group bacterium]|nr:hypothetical protein [Patescibacteria group bacterium]